MKTLLLLSTIFLGGVFAPAHDVPLAVFRIAETDGELAINITFDAEDFSNSLGVRVSEINAESMQDYLCENTSFAFDGEWASLEVKEVRIARDHVEVNGSFGRAANNISELKVENTCLNNVPRHTNVMEIDLNGKSRDFRMHKGRTVISVAY